MAAVKPPAGEDLAFAGVAAQADLVRTGALSSRELVELSLRRIEALDPALNSFRVVLAERALAEAEQADARRRAGEDRPLLGVPLAVKDDTDVAGVPTGKGSIAPPPTPAADAEIIGRLRAAGAVIVGKTNVPELMTMPFTETAWFGATRNPWDLDRTPGGSSGGSAAAVAAGLVPGATGSDGAGSIRIPAACCGLVGLKPQRGRVPTPLSWNGLSTYGFEARTARDAGLLHDAVKTGGPSLAEAAAQPPGRLRIAVSVKPPPGIRGRPDTRIRGALEAAQRLLREAGHEVVERELDYGMSGLRVIARYFGGIAEDARSMPRLDRLDRRSRGLARIGSLIPQSVLQQAIAAADADRARLEASFGDADVVLTPLLNRLPLRIGELEGRGAAASFDAVLNYVPFAGLFNHTGQPALAIPVDYTPEGFPLAVQLIARNEGDALLLSLAGQLEPVVGWADRRPPFATDPGASR